MLAACAGDPAQAPAPASKGPRSTLFLSPAGEPVPRRPPASPYPVGVWFAQADANHDGKLTRDEFRADFAKFFKVLDEDHNGILDGVETQRYEQAVAPEVLPRLAQVQGGFPGERAGARPAPAGRGAPHPRTGL
ncbi:MAG: hypothetical protein WDN45_00820 [Caulobacteraceae bacterium]